MNQPRFQELVDKYLDETLSPDELVEFEQQLRETPAYFDALYNAAELDGRLASYYADAAQEQFAESVEAELHGRSDAAPLSARAFRLLSSQLSYSLLTAACALPVLVIVVLYLVKAEPAARRSAALTAASSSREFVGRLTQVAAPVWADESTAPLPGSFLTVGQRLSLRSGEIEIALKTGTRVVLEGPVELSLVDPQAVELHDGKLAALVEQPLKGFRVETPLATITDLGTEFQVAVADGAASVQVAKGRVQINSRPGGNGKVEVHLLSEGEAANITALRGFARRAFNPGAFAALKRFQETDAAAWRPTPGDGLLLWLQADKGVAWDAAGGVQRWSDQSGRGFDAVQPNAAQRPRGTSERNAVRFDGLDDFLVCESSLGVRGEADFTAALLLRTPEAAVDMAGLFSLRSKRAADWNTVDGLALTQWRRDFTEGVAVQQKLAPGGVVTAGANELLIAGNASPEQFGSVVLVKQSGDAGLWINGASVGFDRFDFSANTLPEGNYDLGYCLGARVDGGRTPRYALFGKFELLEILIYDRTLSHQEIRGLNHYFKQRLTELGANGLQSTTVLGP